MKKHDDRPQLQNVTAVTEHSVKLNWLLGTYTSVFKPYKVGGKVVTASKFLIIFYICTLMH